MCRINQYLVINFFLFMTTIGFALPTDKMQKIHLRADSGIYNYKTGVNIYEGNVIIDQGSTHITADKVITKRNAQHEVEEALAFGKNKLAHYWTTQKPGDAPMHAYAHIIKFYPITSNVRLEKNVLVQQAENSFKGDLILYNSYEQTINVPPTKNGRASIIFNPESKS